MPTTPLHRRRLHRALVGGVALAALAAGAAMPALAGTLSAGGGRVLASEQRQDGAVASIAAGSQLVVVPAGGDSAEVADNAVTAVAGASDVVQTFASGQTDAPGSGMSHVLSSPGGLWADSDIAIASGQIAGASPVTAAITDARLAIEAEATGTPALAIHDNALGTSASANRASGALDLSGRDGPSAAMLASLQSVTPGSRVTAHTQGMLGVTLAGPAGATGAIENNSARAAAAGNGATQSLAARPGAWTGTAASGPTAMLAAANRNLAARAAFLVSADQHLSAPVAARTTITRDISGMGAAASRIVLSGNAADARTTGNRAEGRMEIDALAMTAQGAGGWPVSLAPAAGLLVASQSSHGIVSAGTTTRGGISLSGSASASHLGIGDERASAGAIANSADSSLEVRAAGALAVGLAGGGTCLPGCGGGPEGPGGYIGTAAIQSDGGMSVTAPFALLSSQIASGPVTARTLAAGDGIAVGGSAGTTTLLVGGNAASAAALANQATSSLTLAGGVVATAADLASRQEASGRVTAITRWNADPAMPALRVGGPVSGSLLAVNDNTASTSAAGNLAANTLSVDGASLPEGSGHVGSSAGLAGGNAIASAAHALASGQILRASTGPGPQVAASTAAGARIAIPAGASGSRLAVDDNEAQALARGNSVSNRLSIAGAMLGAGGRGMPGAALASAQDADATVRAASRQTLAIAGPAEDARLTISGNGNAASAVLNEADNALGLDVAGSTGWRTGLAQAMPHAASGDLVLASRQSAAGTAAANAAVTADLATPGWYGNGSLAISANRVVADAGANRGTNRADVALGADPQVGTLVHNRQDSTAAVSAAASLQASIAGGYAAASDLHIADNSITAGATGNTAANTLVLGHAGQAAGFAPLVTAEPMATSSALSLLVNEQANSGPVRAGADFVAAIALNCPGSDSASLALSGNSLRADARGNSAVNAITAPAFPAPGSVGLVNAQVNSGMVLARVSSPVTRILPGARAGNALAMTGNALVATAIGNLAANSIGIAN